jgi:hypothetical protein
MIIFLTNVFRYFTLRQAQGEDLLNPHAEPVEAKIEQKKVSFTTNVDDTFFVLFY